MTEEARQSFRVFFEAPNAHEAGALAAVLRADGRHTVQVRHAPARGWTVTATTELQANAREAVRLWESELEDLARRHPGCRVAGWLRLPQPGD